MRARTRASPRASLPCLTFPPSSPSPWFARHGADAGPEHDLPDLALDQQGPRRGSSLGGVALGFVFYMLCAAFGITALLFAVPYAYDALRFAGAPYLLCLAWQALKPGGRSPFQVRTLKDDGPRKLFAMGLVTNLLNPKIAMMYLRCCRSSSPAVGSVLTQSLVLGACRSSSASRQCRDRAHRGIDRAVSRRAAAWLLVQRWLMGTVLAGLAVRIALEARKA